MNEFSRGIVVDRVFLEFFGFIFRVGFLCGGRGQVQMIFVDFFRERFQVKGFSIVFLVIFVFLLSQGFFQLFSLRGYKIGRGVGFVGLGEEGKLGVLFRIQGFGGLFGFVFLEQVCRLQFFYCVVGSLYLYVFRVRKFIFCVFCFGGCLCFIIFLIFIESGGMGFCLGS